MGLVNRVNTPRYRTAAQSSIHFITRALDFSTRKPSTNQVYHAAKNQIGIAKFQKQKTSHYASNINFVFSRVPIFYMARIRKMKREEDIQQPELREAGAQGKQAPLPGVCYNPIAF